FQWIRGTMIGKGSQGKVYMALNVTTGEIMAVKQVERPGAFADGDGLRRIADALREEQETLRDLNHPNVVQYLGFEENRQTLNIFLEYVSGGTIDSCVKAFGKLREDVTKHFTRQILEGLAYLHSEGILHRDLKAANILVMDSGACKISDFGISKRNSRAFSFTGTSYCMAPETLSPGVHGYDAKVDIWSVGCVVQQMWTAMRAWLDVDFLTVWCRLGEGELPPLPSDVSLSMLAHHFRQECFQIAPDCRPSAEFLLLHPYLDLPPDWEFPGMR
ncbi:kinase-like domain-containing protein, partial [Crepidotus variabilis]